MLFRNIQQSHNLSGTGLELGLSETASSSEILIPRRMEFHKPQSDIDRRRCDLSRSEFKHIVIHKRKFRQVSGKHESPQTSGTCDGGIRW